MRADPGDEQDAAQHHERPDLALVFRRQFVDAAVTPDPGCQEPGNLGPMLEERDRRGAVVEIPGEAAIVEIDDLGHRAIDEEIGEPHVAMDEPESVLALAESRQPLADQLDGPPDEVDPLGRHAHAVAPPPPMRPLADAGREVPAVALEAGRSAPAHGMAMHAGRDLSEDLEW